MFRRSTIPWIVLAISLALTGTATTYVSHTARSKAQQRFEHDCESTSDDIRSRLGTYIALLRGTAGLFAASRQVTVTEFRTFVDRLSISTSYPGIQGIGFAAFLPVDSVDLSVGRMREEVGSDFRLWPEPTATSPAGERTAIVYLEPLDKRNQAAIGYDMFSDPIRREAMIRARDSGVAAASGRVTLVQEIDAAKQPGFLIYVPVYRSMTLPQTVEERRRLLAGYVYSPYRAADLLYGVFGTQSRPRIHFRIYDESVRPESLLYDSRDNGERDGPGLQGTRSLVIAGRTWVLEFAGRQSVARSSESDVTILSLASGLVVSVLLFGISWGQAQARSAAEIAAGELRQSQEALRLSEERARAIIQSSVIGIVVVGRDGLVREANEAFLTTFGYRAEELAGGLLEAAHLTPESAGSRPSAEAVLQSGRGEPFERDFRHRDGRLIPALVSVAYLGGSEGLSVWFILDLTQMKQARETELRYARHVSLRADISLALATRSETAGFLQACAEAIVTQLDAALVRIWLRSEDGTYLNLRASAGLYTHVDGPHSRIEIGQLKVGRIAQAEQPMLSNDLANDDLIDDRQWAIREQLQGFAGSPLRVDGRVIGVVALFARRRLSESVLDAFSNVSDLIAQGVERQRVERALVTYREHLEQLVLERTDQLRASQEKLRRSERLASLGTLATGIAHEINNPANAILLSAQYALTTRGDADWDQAVTAALQDIEREARRCGRIVRNVLQFGRAERSHLTPDDLNDVVRHSCDLASSYVGDRLELELRLAPRLPQVNLDASQIEQVIVNLIQNSSQAAGPGVKVCLQTSSSDHGVSLIVRDNGPGIAAEHLPHVFDPFFSTRREKGGTGLGLSMVHGIITEHSGTIEVSSTPGKGAEFRIHFPAATPAGGEG